jgi:hypothetical protein
MRSKLALPLPPFTQADQRSTVCDLEMVHHSRHISQKGKAPNVDPAAFQSQAFNFPGNTGSANPPFFNSQNNTEHSPEWVQFFSRDG